MMLITLSIKRLATYSRQQQKAALKMRLVLRINLILQVKEMTGAQKETT